MIYLEIRKNKWYFSQKEVGLRTYEIYFLNVFKI